LVRELGRRAERESREEEKNYSGCRLSVIQSNFTLVLIVPLVRKPRWLYFIPRRRVLPLFCYFGAERLGEAFLDRAFTLHAKLIARRLLP
jgi:hypothetical protein